MHLTTMARLSLLITFAVLTNATVFPPPDNTYILSWINEYLSSSQGVYPFDPSPSQTLPLAVNNLLPTTEADVRYYVYFAAIAYCDQSRRDWDCTYCQVLGNNVTYDSEVTGSPTQNTLAYFACDDERQEIILSFRGSLNVPNAVYDNENTLVPLSDTDTSGIMVHKGFLAALETLYPQVVARLTSLTQSFPTYKVVVTGHSLGASLAALAVFKFKYESLFQKTNFELFTYGEPRCGNQAFATAFNFLLTIPVARVVHRAEFAPHIVAQYNQGYVHHQNEVCEVSQMDIRFCNRSVYEDPNCSNSQGPIYSILDHFDYAGRDGDVDVVQCGFNDPIATILQAIVNLNAFVPQNLILKLLLNFFRIQLKYQIILDPLLTYLG